MKKTMFSLIMVLLLLGLTINTYAETSIPESQKYGGIYRSALTVGPATPFGYPAESGPNAVLLATPTLEPLLRIKKGGTFEPMLATSWKATPDGKSLIVTLRKGVKFHDGTDFNAKAAKWNLEKTIAAKKVRNYTSVEVIDDYTIRIGVKSLSNIVITAMSDGGHCMISPTAVEKNGIEWARWHPVGTGPFKFTRYDRDSKLVFEKNENYWVKGKPYLDGIENNVISDVTVRKIAFQRGDIMTLQAKGLDAQELKKNGFPYYTDTGGTYVLIPDSKNPDSPFADKRVRLAVSYGLDRKVLADALGLGFARPAYQIHPGSETARIPNLDIHEYNPEKARKLLAEAGYPDGLKAGIHAFIRRVPRDWIVAIVNMLQEVGIELQADFPEAGKYSELRFQGWKNSLMAHGMAFLRDNVNYGITFYFSGPQFPSLKKPEAWERVYNAAVSPINIEADKSRALFKLMHDEAMVIPYIEETNVMFFQKGYHSPFEEYQAALMPKELIWLEPNLR